jgi:hypothetical protein
MNEPNVSEELAGRTLTLDVYIATTAMVSSFSGSAGVPEFLVQGRAESISVRQNHTEQGETRHGGFTLISTGHDEEKDDLKTIFDGLAKRWRDETEGSSLTMRRYAHPSYQAILVLGGREPEVVKLILQEMQKRPDMWFEALRRLTDKNPAEYAKSFEDATKAWLEWGRKERLIS